MCQRNRRPHRYQQSLPNKKKVFFNIYMAVDLKGRMRE